MKKAMNKTFKELEVKEEEAWKEYCKIRDEISEIQEQKIRDVIESCIGKYYKESNKDQVICFKVKSILDAGSHDSLVCSVIRTIRKDSGCTIEKHETNKYSRNVLDDIESGNTIEITEEYFNKLANLITQTIKFANGEL